MTARTPVLIVTVRGSTEPASGSRLLTPVARAISRSYPGDVLIRNLPYPATFESFDAIYPARIDLGESPTIGVHNLVTLLNEQAESRPDQRVVLLGWSQGAQVIGDTLIAPTRRFAGRGAAPLDAHAQGSIAAIALFGNPTFTAGEPHNAGKFHPGVSGVQPRPPGALSAYTGRLRDYCAAGDIAAQNAPGSNVEGHVSYFHNDLPAQAATFALARLTSGPAISPAPDQR